jgi:hypothetical protein
MGKIPFKDPDESHFGFSPSKWLAESYGSTSLSPPPVEGDIGASSLSPEVAEIIRGSASATTILYKSRDEYDKGNAVVIVESNGVTVRNGPHPLADITGKALCGTEHVIEAIEVIGHLHYGQIAGGWIVLKDTRSNAVYAKVVI